MLWLFLHNLRWRHREWRQRSREDYRQWTAYLPPPTDQAPATTAGASAVSIRPKRDRRQRLRQEETTT
jgi:hypothetical protein